jgi:hypothetical protein
VGFRNLGPEKLAEVYASLNIIWVIKLRIVT